ncbi:hypothetical protein HELRODRAFT_88036 [Helobdella robusta]|uniref:phosphoenolpyruvate carboxykinase (GTP) n=1 Tax=Helobdella robusta TaxID=6412 RepID=T1G6X6_HELRO|nr:hypothetical protein HELRODRAFT_88036 [Helobdella robusta]ESN93840.1 hypothetical protein HELRODRAFT_88036 [Helobdella robusta]
MDSKDIIEEVDDVTLPEGGVVHVPVVKGFFLELPLKVQEFVATYVDLLQPKGVYICDGSEEEEQEIADKLVDRGLLIPLKGMEKCFACRTDPKDVARVENKTFIVTEKRSETVPTGKKYEGYKDDTEIPHGMLGRWMSRSVAEEEMASRLPGSMRGRVMYIIPFSMGPVGGPASKSGVQITDFNYVILSMRIMTRVTPEVWDAIEESPDQEFVQCIHTIGAPRPLQRKVINHWPDDAEHIMIAHFPLQRRVISYGSGYGGNSLLGKKCFALRIASCMARDEGWLAEHMLIMSVTDRKGVEKFFAAAFPSACGKTNMAMMTPSIPGFKVQVIGDDIAWMRFDSNGQLRAINPENGFFGVAPGTNWKTNPVAMQTAQKNTIFTNVGITDDGKVFWEGMEKEIDPNTSITTWTGEKWKIGMEGKAAHPNSRFCVPASQCPVIHPLWEHPDGVPISGIIFGGRRPRGVPLVFESFDWKHGVMIGAALKSEATAAAEHKAGGVMHDPMAMRPFFGYNFGKYLDHWLSMDQPGRQLPKIFHVNWFRLDQKTGKFLWPGFGDNIRVVDWMIKRIDGEDVAVESPVGWLPKKGSIDTSGLDDVNWDELFSLPKEYWMEDVEETKSFFEDEVGKDMPQAVYDELEKLKKRVQTL